MSIIKPSNFFFKEKLNGFLIIFNGEKSNVQFFDGNLILKVKKYEDGGTLSGRIKYFHKKFP
jgi:hypothetical protein